MSQGCRSHLAGPLTIIINGPFGRDGTEISLAIQVCQGCGRTFTNDTLVLTNMDATGKATLNGTLAQLPTGNEIFDQLFQLDVS